MISTIEYNMVHRGATSMRRFISRNLLRILHHRHSHRHHHLRILLLLRRHTVHRHRLPSIHRHRLPSIHRHHRWHGGDWSKQGRENNCSNFREVDYCGWGPIDPSSFAFAFALTWEEALEDYEICRHALPGWNWSNP
jgi:hypothetical protein